MSCPMRALVFYVPSACPNGMPNGLWRHRCLTPNRHRLGDQCTKTPTPLSPLNNPTLKQALFAMNRDENARLTDRNPHEFTHTSTHRSARWAAGLAQPLGSSSFSLPMTECVVAKSDDTDTRGTWQRPRPQQARGGADVAILGSTPSSVEHKVLQTSSRAC
ncbi:hypothetical protein V8E53_003099 [Lactarius tabidus]